MTNSHNHQASQHAIESFTPQPQSPADHDDASTKDSLTTANDGFVSQQPAIIAGEKYHQSRGVTRMENVAYFAKHGGRVGRTTYYLIGVSVLVCMFVSSMEGSTISNYQQFATSTFGQHSEGLAALGIATNIISAVSKPFVAKLGDVTSRPFMFTIILTVWVLGFVVSASSSTLSAYIVGSTFVAVGSSGIDLLSDIICGDLVPLEWRGFCSSLLAFPYFITTWFTGLIVEALAVEEKWRWGYGMWAIIMPASLAPAIAMLFYLERKAQQSGVVNIASSKRARREAQALAQEKGETFIGGRGVAQAALRQPWWSQVKQGLVEIDAFGLVLMGFGWCLLLLPFALKSGAENGWKNPSLIAMMIVGGLLLVAYVLFERYYAPFPTMPRRILYNKTFIMAVIIDSIYTLAGGMRSTYLGSYIWIVTDLSTRDWSYLLNSLTLALCFFGLIAGLIQRWTHRYKLLQVIGLGIKIIGMGLLVSGGKGTTSVVNFVFIQLLVGAGGAFSVVGSRVASQASVPHQDLGLVISLLALWSKIGTSIGSAIAGAVWGEYMPKYLRQELPASVTNAQVTKYFGNIKTIRAVAWDSPIRDGAIRAYQETVYKLWVPALALSFIPFVAAFFQTDYFLGKQQNAVTNTDIAGQRIENNDNGHLGEAKTVKEKLIRFWAGRQWEGHGTI